MNKYKQKLQSGETVVYKNIECIIQEIILWKDDSDVLKYSLLLKAKDKKEFYRVLLNSVE